MFRWLFGDTPQRHYEQGMRLYNGGDYESSLEAFDLALDGLMDDSHPYVALARFYRAEAQAKIGARLLRDGRDLDALRYLDAALSEQPGYPDLHFRKAVAHYRQGDPGKAEKSAQSALKINGDLAEARVLISVILRERGENEAAETELQRAREAGKRRPTALTRFLDEGPRAPGAEELWQHLFDEESLRRRIDRAESLYLAGDLESSRRAIEELLRSYPDFPDLRFKLALILFREGDLAGALIHLEHALTIHPGFADALVLSAAVLLHQGEVESARRRYARAREGAALPSPFADYGLALCLHLEGDEEACDKLIRPLLSHGEVPAEVLNLLACTRALEGQTELARAAYEDLLRNHPGPQGLLDAVAFHLRSGAIDAAESCLNQLDQELEDPALTLARAEILVQKDKLGSAAALLDEYEEEAGLQPALAVLRAQIHRSLNEESRALRKLEEVLKRWPESAAARRERVRILAGSGRVEEALEEQEQLRNLRAGSLADEICHLQLLRRKGEVAQCETSARRLTQLYPLSLRVRSQQRERWLGPLSAVDPAPLGEVVQA
ncbi:MAG TPA: tetratricopeptide repeat protein [Candidatus Krumholzibacteria bacterium]|nr:tetratricopeptide repeat protein [Candidatus Krumholzibacteria bacterium]